MLRLCFVSLLSKIRHFSIQGLGSFLGMMGMGIAPGMQGGRSRTCMGKGSRSILLL